MFEGTIVFKGASYTPPPLPVTPAAKGKPAETILSARDRDPNKRKVRGFSSTLLSTDTTSILGG